MRLNAKNTQKCLLIIITAYPKKSLDHKALLYKISIVVILPHNTNIIMINKIKKALVDAVVNSDTFKSTLENSVSEEVQVIIDNSDEIVTSQKLENELRDIGYNYDIPDKDDVARMIDDEIDCCDFAERSEIEEMINFAIGEKDLKVCDAGTLRSAFVRHLQAILEFARKEDLSL